MQKKLSLYEVLESLYYKIKNILKQAIQNVKVSYFEMLAVPEMVMKIVHHLVDVTASLFLCTFTCVFSLF